MIAPVSFSGSPRSENTNAPLLVGPSMVDAMHLGARFFHVGAAMLWVGYLAFLSMVLFPAARNKQAQHAPNLGPLVQRLAPLKWLGPIVLLTGFWLITATGRPISALITPGWGHAITTGIVLAIAMMGLEHALIYPRFRDAHQGPQNERENHLQRAHQSAIIATLLGLAATALMILALLGP